MSFFCKMYRLFFIVLPRFVHLIRFRSKFDKKKRKLFKCDTCKGDLVFVPIHGVFVPPPPGKDDTKFVLDTIADIKCDLSSKYDNKTSEVELKQLITKSSALEVKQELRGRGVIQFRTELLGSAKGGMGTATEKQLDMEQHSRCANIEVVGVPTKLYQQTRIFMFVWKISLKQSTYIMFPQKERIYL